MAIEILVGTPAQIDDAALFISRTHTQEALIARAVKDPLRWHADSWLNAGERTHTRSPYARASS